MPYICIIKVKQVVTIKNIKIMKTITVKVKFKITGLNKTKSIKIGIESPKDKFPCFSELVNKVYSTKEPRLDKLFNEGYIIGVEEIR